MSTNLILILSGAACLGVCSTIFYKAMPRSGRPESALVATEARAMSIGILVLILFFAGATLMFKGLLQ
jgi:hypothetical protein